MSDIGLLSKFIKGTGLRGAVNYASRNGELAPLCGNMAGATPRALAAEFSAARVLRPSCKKACWHFILSLPDQTDDLSQEEWDKAARTYLKEMGVDPDRHQWVGFKHTNTDHPHLHIIASRIAIRDGKLAREHRGDYRLSHKAAAAASRAVGLKPVAPAPSHQRRAALRRGELAHAERVTGSPHKHPKLQIATRLDAALAHASSLEQFQSIAADHGVDVKFSSNSGGIYGVSYRLAEPAEREGFKVEWMKGSQVGKAYTISSITRRLAGEIDTPTSRHGPRVRQDILQKLAREQQAAGKEILRWSNGYVAAVATSSEIRWRTGSAAEAAVCAALAREKGWAEMVLSDRGSDEKNRAAIEAYHRAGISVQLKGQRYPAPGAAVTKQELSNGNDGRDPRAGQGGGGIAAPDHGVVEVDGISGQRPPQKDQRPGGTAQPTAPAAAGAGGAAGQAVEDDQRHRPAAEKTTASTNEGEEVDLLEFLSDPAGARERAQRALEDLSEVNPGDHSARIVAEAHQMEPEAVDTLDFLEQGQTAEPNPDPITAQEQAPVTHQPQPAPDPTPTGEDLRLAEDEAVAQLAKYEGDMEGAKPRTSAQIKIDLVAVRHQREWHEMQSLIHRLKPSTVKEIAALRAREVELGIALSLARKREAEARRQIRRDPAAMAAIHTRATGIARERVERKRVDELRRMAEKAKQELVRQQKEEEAERRRKAEENQRPAKKVKKGQKNAA